MSASRKLIDELNRYSKNNFWNNPPGNPTFQEVLDRYANYAANLAANERDDLEILFWNQIKEIKTPIIEELSNDEVKVHFLFPRNKYDHEGKKLYISGDYHGFTSTNNERQEMHRIGTTNIMHRSNNIPKDSIIIYHFLQVPPKYQNKSRAELVGPSEELPESFYDIDPIPPVFDDPIGKEAALKDEYSKHEDFVGTLFCANLDNDLSSVHLMKNTDWKKLLSPDCDLKNLSHQGTYLCDIENRLNKDKNAADEFMNKIFNDKEHTRSVTVFAPKEGPAKNLIIINDGVSYMATGAIERIDSLMGKGVPKKTSIICIESLPGLIEKYKKQSPKDFANAKDPRLIEFCTKIEDYITFIDEAKKQLGYDYIPANNITVIGASMSGNASLRMVLEHKEKFGKAIAQAPTESTRIILFPAIQKRKLAKENGEAEDLTGRIQLSCGKFDSLQYAQNLRLAHTEELAEVLGNEKNHPLPIHSGNYGHTACCWSQELTETLPKLYHQLKPKGESVGSQSIFSSPSPQDSSIKNDKPDEKVSINIKKGGSRNE